ncbi:MAG: hypothetical protein H8E18_16100 [FCB group bacterium]|nr:hypothetical protein [FCB group bacterium]
MQYQNMMDYTTIEKILSTPNPFLTDPETASQLRFDALKASFKHHFINNVPYQAFCIDENIKPALVKSRSDLSKIPLIPSDFFRDVSAAEGIVDSISSVPSEQIARYFTTSGTGGQPSIYPYDLISLQTINRSNVIIFDKVGDIDPNDYVLFLTPSPEQADTGMVQGMYLTLKGLLQSPEKQVGFAVENNILDSRLVIEELNEIKGKTRHLYGPPYAFNEISDQIIEGGLEINLDLESKAFTTGGWKSHKTGQISKDELDAKIEKAFKIKQTNVRDGLGLTDIMSILLECEYGSKHVPPWIEVSIRDLNDPTWQTTVPLGEGGLIAFLDPLIGSFPAYIVTGDVGKLDISYNQQCNCGRYGPTITYLRRAGDPRGCALRQEHLMAKVNEAK